MAKELDLQTKLVHSVRRDKGYARKLTNRFTIGVPDLLISLHPFIPCYGEVKDLGEVVDNFDRKIEVTDKQGLEIWNLDQTVTQFVTPYTPDRHAALVLVGIVHRKKHRLVALSCQGRQKYSDPWRLDHTYESEPGRWTERQVGGHYDLKPLMEWAGIARVGVM